MDRRSDRLSPVIRPDVTSDAELLREYSSTRSPEAFAAIVDRYLPLVYSAAMRQTRDTHLAEDATQATLLILTRKAGGIDPGMLAGWLMKTAHYTARNAVRQSVRRAVHERQAGAMRMESQGSEEGEAVSVRIDAALARLREADRTAVVLRYFQDKSFAEIAVQMQMTEGAVQRRIARAVEKLRVILTRQGAAVSPAALSAFLAAPASHPIPPTLTARVMSASTLKTASTSVIAKGAVYAMVAAKMKVAVGIAAAVLLVGVAVPTTYHFTAARPEFIPVPPPPVMAFSRPVSGSLPSGMVAEPFAVMRLADKRWFGPDGRERTDVPARVSEMAAANQLPLETYAFCYRIDMSGAATFYSWTETCRGALIYHHAGDYKDPATGIYYRVMRLIPDPGSKSITLTIDTTDRRYVTTAVIPASATAPVQGTIAGLDFTAGPPVQVGDRTRLPVRFGPDTMSRAFHDIYAINAAGKRVTMSRITPVGERAEILEYTFNGSLSSFREFRVDSQLLNYHATYAPVALPPLSPGVDFSRPATGSLPPGMTAEPLAVMNLTDKRWVRPDGRELASLPVDTDKLFSRVGVPGATHAFLFRMVVPDETFSYVYAPLSIRGCASIMDYDAATHAHYVLFLLLPKPDATSVSLKIDVATGPWTTWAVVPASAAAPIQGALDGRSFTLNPPVQKTDRVRITQNASNVTGQYTDSYAISVAGKKVDGWGANGDGRGHTFYDFEGQLASYKEFRFVARPYNYNATYVIPLSPAKQ